MKKFIKISAVIVKIIFVGIILWFCAYFIFGEKLSIKFSNREWQPVFIQFLVFMAGVSVYGIFILSIRSKNRKWLNLLLFFGGLILGSLPLLFYHGYLQYRCGFWNEIEESSKVLYVNSINPDETVKIIQKKCETGDKVLTDTVFVKKLNDYFELEHTAIIKKSKNGNWKTE